MTYGYEYITLGYYFIKCHVVITIEYDSGHIIHNLTCGYITCTTLYGMWIILHNMAHGYFSLIQDGCLSICMLSESLLEVWALGRLNIFSIVYFSLHLNHYNYIL